MGKTKKALRTATTPAPPDPVHETKRAVIVELENIALGGRQICFDIVKKVFGSKGIPLDRVTFSRTCIEVPARKFVPCLLKLGARTRLSEEKLLGELTKSMREVLASDKLKIAPGFTKLLKAAAQRNVMIGVVSDHGPEFAERMLGQLGMDRLLASVVSTEEEDGTCPRANVWLSVARNLGVSPMFCVAIATSAASCKAVVAARMRCVVVPDAFTAHHDFSGADYVFDALTDSSIETILGLIKV